MEEKLTIGIILGSTREGRVSPDVGKWVKGIADERGDAHYEIVDIKDYKLPLLGEAESPGIKQWTDKIETLDGFVFIVQEYNHSLSAALKNALDLGNNGWRNKAAGMVSYGSTGGARAAEHLRGIMGELSIADVRTHPTLSLFYDFKCQKFEPQAFHADTVNAMLNQVIDWTTALKPLRD